MQFYIRLLLLLLPVLGLIYEAVMKDVVLMVVAVEVMSYVDWMGIGWG